MGVGRDGQAMCRYFTKIKRPEPWPVWLSWLEHHPADRKVLVPTSARAWVADSVSGRGVYEATD